MLENVVVSKFIILPVYQLFLSVFSIIIFSLMIYLLSNMPIYDIPIDWACAAVL